MTLDGDATPPTTSTPAATPHDIGHALEHMRDRWRWFAAFGLITMFCGFISLGVAGAATLVSVYMIAAFMILIGAVEITIGVNAHRWSSRIFVVLVGLLYIVAGSFALANPLSGAVGFTLMLGAALVATGLARVIFATRLPEGPPRDGVARRVHRRRLAGKLHLRAGDFFGRRHDHVRGELAEFRDFSAPARDASSLTSHAHIALSSSPSGGHVTHEQMGL